MEYATWRLEITPNKVENFMTLKKKKKLFEQVFDQLQKLDIELKLSMINESNQSKLSSSFQSF